MMPRDVMYVTSLLLLCVTGVSSISYVIIPPVVSTGLDAAVIVVPETGVPGHAYTDLGESQIQSLRFWISDLGQK